MGKAERVFSVERRVERKVRVSVGVKVSRSRRSAPAEKACGVEEVRIRARGADGEIGGTAGMVVVVFWEEMGVRVVHSSRMEVIW